MRVWAAAPAAYAVRVGGLRVAMVVEQLWQPVPGGSGTYIRELVRELQRTAGSADGVELVGLAGRSGDPSTGPAGLTVRRSRLPRAALYASWQRLRRPRAERLAGPVDVVHATTWAIPGGRRPLVVTVHDLAFLREPQHFTPHGTAFFRRAWQVTLDQAARVVVPSAATAADCVAAGLDPDRVTVVPHGVRADHPTPGQLRGWRERHGVARAYVLWCGTVEPRKNLARAVRGWTQARRRGLDLDLVLVGPSGWGGTDDLAAALAAADPSAVHRLGRLSSADLQSAYAGATAFVFPSLWEGSGMPVLEAMAHGVPVVTSAGTSMAEFAASAGVLVDPTSVEQIAEGLLQVRAWPQSRRADVRAEAARYDWAASAAAHVRVYREAAGVAS